MFTLDWFSGDYVDEIVEDIVKDVAGLLGDAVDDVGDVLGAAAGGAVDLVGDAFGLGVRLSHRLSGHLQQALDASGGEGSSSRDGPGSGEQSALRSTADSSRDRSVARHELAIKDVRIGKSQVDPKCASQYRRLVSLKKVCDGRNGVECGRVFAPGDTWCGKCGAKRPEACSNPECDTAFFRKDTMYCPDCGTKRIDERVMECVKRKIEANGQAPPQEHPKILAEDYEHERIARSKRFPWFIVAQSGVAFMLWFVGSLTDNSSTKSWISTMAGMESIWPGKTDLRVTDIQSCDNVQREVWRWLTYQYSHAGLTHVLMNCIMNLVLGIRLEKLHGHVRAFALYNLGVFGGTCCFWVTDVFTPVIGMSGGCYSLIGVHFAYLVINWSQKKYRWPTLFLLLFLVAFEFFNVMVLVDDSGDGAKVSHAVHLGGAVAGLIFGILLGENMQEHQWEVYLKRIVGFIGMMLIVFCFVWGFVFWPPMTIFDPVRWCWQRSVFNRTLFGDDLYHCVRCSTEECMDLFGNMPWVNFVSLAYCEEHGWDWSD